MNQWRRRDTFWNSIVLLIGHLAATALVFVSLFTFGWLVSWIFSAMNAIHPFADPVWRLVNSLEMWLTYLDLVVSGVVLLAGVVRFFRDLLEG